MRRNDGAMQVMSALLKIVWPSACIIRRKVTMALAPSLKYWRCNTGAGKAEVPRQTPFTAAEDFVLANKYRVHSRP